MILYDFARRIKAYYKKYQKKRAGRFLSPVRRIERVAPLSDGRYVTMTFDDGPSAAQTNPRVCEGGLSLHLVDTLEKYGAHGTFDVIGTTAGNYPDEQGKNGYFSWSGVKYDHYPDFGKDELAGVVAQGEIARRMADGGHELTSHGYAHILFGKMQLIYGRRCCFKNIHEVIADLKKLDTLCKNSLGVTLSAARPPHYVDKTPDARSSYDAYRFMNYQYLAASFDGGGWKASSGNYENDVRAMVAPLRDALSKNPDSLNGQIIFQKDGCSMSRLTPIASALAQQLELLSESGYKVITFSELIAMSPFSDTGDSDAIFPVARELMRRGYCLAYRNNTLQPDRICTMGEYITMSVSPEGLLNTFREYVERNFTPSAEAKALARSYRIKPTHPYFVSLVAASREGLLEGMPRDIRAPMMKRREAIEKIAERVLA